MWFKMAFFSREYDPSKEQQQMHEEIQELERHLKGAFSDIRQYDKKVAKHIDAICDTILFCMDKIDEFRKGVRQPNHDPEERKAIERDIGAIKSNADNWKSTRDHAAIITNLRDLVKKMHRDFQVYVGGKWDFEQKAIMKHYEIILECLRDLDNISGDISQHDKYMEIFKRSI
jgi:hypothetical protein